MTGPIRVSDLGSRLARRPGRVSGRPTRRSPNDRTAGRAPQAWPPGLVLRLACGQVQMSGWPVTPPRSALRLSTSRGAAHPTAPPASIRGRPDLSLVRRNRLTKRARCRRPRGAAGRSSAGRIGQRTERSWTSPRGQQAQGLLAGLAYHATKPGPARPFPRCRSGRCRLAGLQARLGRCRLAGLQP
jgi:hypothetical protein